MNELKYVEMKDLKESKIQLRPVDKRTVEYQELKDSIKTHGLWQPILIRPTGNSYEVVDGFYRYNCCKELRHKTIPCFIRELSDSEVLVVQIQTNAVRLETDPVDYARQIWRIIKEKKEMTVGEMAHLIKKSPVWVRKMLKISRLCSEVNTAVRQGQISLTIAHEIAKVPPKIQRELLPQAIVFPVGDFLPVIRKRVRQFKEAIRTGRMKDYYQSFIEPIPHLRKMENLKNELKTMTEAAKLVTKEKAKTAMEGWNLCLRWVLHLDPEAVAEQKNKLAIRYEEEEKQADIRKQDRRNRTKNRN